MQIVFWQLSYDIRCTSCHEEAENFTHLFWFCSKIELFWKHLIASLKDCNCLSDDYLLNDLVVLSSKPDTYKTIINFVLLLARFHIWLCRSKRNIPTFENSKPFLYIFFFWFSFFFDTFFWFFFFFVFFELEARFYKNLLYIPALFI